VLPNLMGFSKEMLSTDAVTTGAWQCLCAAMAAAISIQYISLPPIRFPNTLVSLGSTISVIMVILSDGVLFCIHKICAKLRLRKEGKRKSAKEVDYMGILRSLLILFNLNFYTDLNYYSNLMIFIISNFLYLFFLF
jgi:hypothetical protein